MEPTVKFEASGRDVAITLRCDTFESAVCVAGRNYVEPPDGYKLRCVTITRRNNSGRRQMLRLDFVHSDRRVPPMTSHLANELFEIDAAVAAGLDKYDEECSAPTGDK